MRTLRKVAFWAGMVVFSPLVSLLILFGSMLNFMQMAFLATFRIENRTDRLLWVTPVGTGKSREHKKAVLLRFAARFPALMALRSRDLPVEPGGSIGILYEWDNENFSEIVVRDSSGEYRQLVVDPDPPRGRSYPNRQELYVIDDWESLPPTEPDVLAVAQEPDPAWEEYGLIATGFVFLGLYAWLIVWFLLKIH